jgi:hypothetical protein
MGVGVFGDGDRPVSNILRKLNVTSRGEAAAAHRLRLISKTASSPHRCPIRALRRQTRGRSVPAPAARAPFMAPPGTDPAAVRAADSLAMLPDDPAAAAEEIQRRREEIGFSYFVFGADFADTLAPVVAELAGR